MRVLFVDRSAVEPPGNGPRGGRVNSLSTITDYLAQSHEVHVLASIEDPVKTDAGVWWISEPDAFYNVIVFNRGMGGGLPNVNARSRILWTHDLPHSGFIPDPRNAAAIDCTVMMSDYGEWIWRKFYKHVRASVRIPNGVNKNLFVAGTKEPGYCIFASSPNRGLGRLPFIWESIQARAGGRMRAYSNLKALHPGEYAPHEELEWFKTCEEAGIERMDPVSQEELGKELGKASLMLLPSDYPEICSNAVLQSLASGTPVITTGGLGATPEWVKHRKNGMLTETKPYDYMAYQVEFVRNATEVLTNNRLHRKLVRGAAKTKIHSWEEIGQKWDKLLRRYG